MRRRVSLTPVFGLAVYAFLLLPVVGILLTSVSSSALFEIPPSGLSVQWFQSFLDSDAFTSAFRMTILLGLVSAFLSCMIGLPCALAVHRHDFPGKALVETLVLSPLLLPSVIIGVSLVSVFAALALSGSFLALVLTHTVLVLPYVVRMVLSSLAGLDGALDEAAMSLGATPRQVFVRVTMPLVSSGLFAGALFAFIVSLSELNASLFIVSAETTTLPIQLFSSMQWDSNPTIAAAAATQIILTLGIVLAIEKMIGLNKMLQF